MNDELRLLVALLQEPGVSGKLIRRLRQEYGTLTVLQSPLQRELKRYPGPLQRGLASLSAHLEKADLILQTCQRLNVQAVPYWDRRYPGLLEEAVQPPAVLYVKGTLSLSGYPAVAVVGTRKPSAYGLRATAHFVEALVAQGVVIVSGLAYGIDAKAHQVALQQGGKTLAVLAHGLDRIYPSAHKRLAEGILAAGAWVSEYPPGTALHPLQFPYRNRIIAGLAHLTLVVESGEKGGALFTARAAFAANRPVYAVPGEVFSFTSRGTHRLIAQQVAQIAYDPSQLLEELELQKSRIPLPLAPAKAPSDPLQARIYQCLEGTRRHVEELAALLSVPIAELTCALTMMEVEGWIEQSPGGWVKRAGPPDARP